MILRYSTDSGELDKTIPRPATPSINFVNCPSTNAAKRLNDNF